MPTDYLLYSNYERQVDALLAGEIDIAWNTNTAYVAAEERIGGDSQVLGMRDVDADFRSVIVTRREQPLEDARSLAGCGWRWAAGTPAMRRSSRCTTSHARVSTPPRECELVRFDTDLGKHGDTGDSELRVLEAVREGNADAGAIGDATWALLRTESPQTTQGLEVGWRSPTYYHCNFTALPAYDGGASGGARRCWRCPTTMRRCAPRWISRA